MSERVKVEPSEIKVGDLIEVEQFANDGKATDGDVQVWRGVVIHANGSSVETAWYTFTPTYYAKYTFYRLPKPAPQEPKGLGAVVRDRDDDLWVRLETGGWVVGDDESSDSIGWDRVLNLYGPLTVLSDGYTQGA